MRGPDAGVVGGVEGIEQPEPARQWLREMGCDLGQGYLFARQDRWGRTFARGRWLQIGARRTDTDGVTEVTVGRARGAALATAFVLALATLVGVGVVPVARAVTRPTATQDSLSQLRVEVDRIADRLAAGAIAYERANVQLGIQVQRKFAAEDALHELLVASATARQRVGSFANALYRNTVSPLFSATLAGDPRLMTDTLFLRRRANQDAGSMEVAAALLQQQATRLQALVDTQDDAARSVTRLLTDLEDRLAALRAEAAANQARLQRLLDDIQAREAAQSALRGGTGATCTSGMPPRAVNGFLPSSALCFVAAAPGHRLAAQAARAFDAMSAAFAADRGKPLCLTDSYRDYAGQVDVFQRKPSLAATPGRSLHGWGIAVDLCGGVQNFGSPEYTWMKVHAARFGFVHPGWAEPNGSRPEAWHWEFRG